MIEAKELRIGNLVISPSLNEITVNARWILEQHQCDLSNCEYLKPIPITEEWLLKFGFKKDNHGFVLHDKMSLSIHFSKELGFVPCWQDFVLSIKYNLKYIHQLQNLYFALTQKELEINGN